VAHNLDEEIRAELYSHMEDKLLGYLSGGEKVTEEDAFILVREHFGNPDTIRGLFQEIHAVETHLSLARRIGAMLAADFASQCAHFVMLSGYLYVFFHYLEPVLPMPQYKGQPLSPFIPLGRMLQFIPITCLALGSVIIMWFILRAWEKKREQGNISRFLRTRPVFFACSVMFLGMLVSLSYRVFDLVFSNHSFGGVGPGHPILSIFQSVQMFLFLTFFPYLRLFVWVWWLDKSSNRITAIGVGLFVWFIYAAKMEEILWKLTIPSWFTSNNIMLTMPQAVRFGKIAVITLVVYIGFQILITTLRRLKPISPW
jgi:hypothetical protein